MAHIELAEKHKKSFVDWGTIAAVFTLHIRLSDRFMGEWS